MNVFSFLYQSTKLLFFNLVLVIQWLFCHHLPPNPTVITSPTTTMVSLAIVAPFVPFPIPCTNWHDKQLKCKASHHRKGSSYRCNVNGLQCFFPPPTILWLGSPTTDVSPFQRNCLHCTQSHPQCQFDANSPLQWKCCIKFDFPCLFKLSSQGHHNDLSISTYAKVVVDSVVVAHNGSTCYANVEAPNRPSTVFETGKLVDGVMVVAPDDQARYWMQMR